MIESDGLTPTERRIAMEEQGYEEHLALREEEGRAAGLAEGRQARNYEIARSMLNKGFDIAVIAEMTGLSGEEIARLCGA